MFAKLFYLLMNLLIDLFDLLNPTSVLLYDTERTCQRIRGVGDRVFFRGSKYRGDDSVNYLVRHFGSDNFHELNRAIITKIYYGGKVAVRLTCRPETDYGSSVDFVVSIDELTFDSGDIRDKPTQ